DGASVPTLAGQLARRIGVAVDEGFINYSLGGPFEYIPLRTVLDWQRAGDRAALQRAFAKKIVMLGSVLPLGARHRAAVALARGDVDASAVPGVMLWGQAVRSLLGRNMVTPVAPWIVALLGAFAGLAWLTAGSSVRALATVLIASAALAG